MESKKLSSSSIGGTLFAGLGGGSSNGGIGTGTSIGGGRVSGLASPSTTTTVTAIATATTTSATSLSSSEIISMIKKGTSVPNPISGKVDPRRGEVESPPPLKAKDNMAMMGLAEIIRSAHSDRSSLALGLDSEAIITAMSATPSGIEQDNNTVTPMLSRLLTSPWAETGTSITRRGVVHSNSLESILPACYNVQAPPHAATRIGTFTEETLFYMFYGMPRDRMQEMAARELTLNRGWRFHRDLKIWLMPTSATPTAASMTAGISTLRMSPAPSETIKSPETICETADVASYITFDQNTWSKVRRELPIVKDQVLEDRFLVGGAVK